MVTQRGVQLRAVLAAARLRRPSERVVPMPMRGKRLESAPAPLLASTSSALVIDERDLDGRFCGARPRSRRRVRSFDDGLGRWCRRAARLRPELRNEGPDHRRRMSHSRAYWTCAADANKIDRVPEFGGLSFLFLTLKLVQSVQDARL